MNTRSLNEHHDSRAEAIASAREFIEANKWQFARSQRFLPHEYNLRKWHEDDAAFLAMVELIRGHGEWQPFGKKRIVCYFVVDGWRYWTMRTQDDDIEAWATETTIINRAEVDDDGRPKYGPKWLTGRDPEPPACCALGEATGGAYHGKFCDRDQLRLDVDAA